MEIEYAHILHNFIRHMEEHMPERAAMAKREAPRWYPNARKFAEYLSERYDMPLNMCIGIIAAMSIRQRWARNQLLAEQYIRCFVGIDCDIGGCFAICIDKCDRIVMSDGEWDTILTILNGQKIVSFADVIKHGNYSKRITIDSIMGLIFGFFKRKKKKGKIGKRAYAAMSNAVRLVADSLGWAYAELQAYAWILMRGRAY